MPHTNRKPVSEHLYSNAELVELRRQMLRYSRSVPARPERNQHLQVAVSLRRLFKNKAWLDGHTVEGSHKGGRRWRPRVGTVMLMCVSPIYRLLRRER